MEDAEQWRPSLAAIWKSLFYANTAGVDSQPSNLAMQGLAV